MDKQTRKGKGFAYVSYQRGEDAVRALAALDASIFQGRIVHLLPARPTPAQRAAAAAAGGAAAGKAAGKGASSYKDKKEAELRASAGDSKNWNALFMRPDAVGDAMAERYGVDKADFLDAREGGDKGGSLAVRLAQGETHLIRQSTAWLAQHGVSLEALEKAASASANRGGGRGDTNTVRSKTLLLVKNLSAEVSQDELTSLFGQYGQLGSVLLTPSNTLGLVEFLEVNRSPPTAPATVPSCTAPAQCRDDVALLVQWRRRWARRNAPSALSLTIS